MPWPIVEVDQHDLLPGPESQAAADDRDGLRGPDQRSPLMGVGIAVMVEAVVLVVTARRNQPVQQRLQVATPPGSYFIVVTAAVEPTTNTDARP